MNVYVVSLSRADNVPSMSALAGDADLVWLVPESQRMDYLRAGAERVITGPPGKADKANAILDTAQEWSVFSDDDLTGMVELLPNGTRQAITIGQAADEFIRVGAERRCGLVTIASASNALYLSRTISAWGQIGGGFYALACGTELRFDPTLGLCEDVDIAAQAFMRYGTCSRINYIQGTYRMGGANSHFVQQYAERQKWFAEVARRYPGLFSGFDDTRMYYTRMTAPRRRLPARRSPR